MKALSNCFISIVLSVISILAYAQEGIYIHLSEQPNKSVKVINSTSTDIVFDIKGDDELIEKNRQRGIIFPLKLSNYKSQKISTITGPMSDDGSFKFERKFEDAASYTEDKNGNRVRIPDSMDDMVGLVINGVIDSKGKMKVNNLTGGNMDAKKEELLYSVFESVALNESAPLHPINIGDSFSTQNPFAMPVPGQQPIQFNNNTQYTFNKIKGDLAIFDVTMSFSLSSPEQGVYINAEGTGSGIMEYNLKTELQEKLDLNIDFKMVIDYGNTKMTSIMKSKSSMQQYIFNPNDKSPNKAPNPTGNSLRESPAG